MEGRESVSALQKSVGGAGRQGRERPRIGCPHPMFEQFWFQRFLAPHLLELTSAAALGARIRQAREERQLKHPEHPAFYPDHPWR